MNYGETAGRKASSALTAVWPKDAADGAAATATAEVIFYRATVPVRVNSLKVLPSAALTGDATNNATLAVKKRDGVGGSASTVASLTTTASWVQFVTVDMGTPANNVLAAGDVLSVTISKGGTGVAVPVSAIEAEIEVL